MKPLACTVVLFAASLGLQACGDDAQTHTTAADETTTSATTGADTAEQPGTVPDDVNQEGDGTPPPASGTPAGTGTAPATTPN